MAASTGLETKLEEVFVKRAPKMPAGGKKAIVEWAPWIALVVGILTLLGAWGLWNAARAVDNIVSGVNNLYAAYGIKESAPVSHLSFWVWLGVAVLAVEAVLYLLAFPGLRDRTRAGWKYLYYGALVNVVYAVVSLFDGNGRVGHFIGAVIGSAIGFWILFQIRDVYNGVKPASTPPKAPVI